MSDIHFAFNKNYKCEVFNLGNNRSEQLINMIALIEKELGKKRVVDFQPMLGDLSEPFADINKSIEKLKYKPTTNIDVGINNFIGWYKEYDTVV